MVSLITILVNCDTCLHRLQEFLRIIFLHSMSQFMLYLLDFKKYVSNTLIAYYSICMYILHTTAYIKIEGKRRRRQQRVRWLLDSFTDSMDMHLSKLQEILEDRGAWHAAIHSVAKRCTQSSDWTTYIKHTIILLWTMLLIFLFWSHFISKIFLKISKLQKYYRYHSPISPNVHILYNHNMIIKTKILNRYSWIIEKAREFQKNIYFCFIDYAKAFDCVDHKKLGNSERDGNTRPPDLPLEKFVCRSGSNS